jgi:hypothetical protein
VEAEEEEDEDGDNEGNAGKIAVKRTSRAQRRRRLWQVAWEKISSAVRREPACRGGGKEVDIVVRRRGGRLGGS